MNHVGFITCLLLSLSLFNIAKAENVLNVYTWKDYYHPDLFKIFSSETGIRVNIDNYTNNEELLETILTEEKKYDLIFPSIWMQDLMLEKNLLHKSEINKNPKFIESNDPNTLRSRKDPKAEYCLPYASGTVGIFYNENITGPITSWGDFFDIPQKTGGKISMLDDSREVIAVGLMATGADVNTSDPEKINIAEQYLVEKLPAVSILTYEFHKRIISGKLVAGQFFVGFNNVASRVAGLNYVIPKEGATLFQENMCIPKNAPNKDNAYLFMNFYLRPEIAAMNANEQFFMTPNLLAKEMVTDKIKNNPNLYVDQELSKRLNFFLKIDKNEELYSDSWKRLKNVVDKNKREKY